MEILLEEKVEVLCVSNLKIKKLSLYFGILIMILIFMFFDPVILFPKIYHTEILKLVYKFMGKKYV